MPSSIGDGMLDATDPIRCEGLDRHGYSKFYAAQMKTAWGRLHQSRFALMDGDNLLASAAQYDLDGHLDGRPIRICGIGSIVVDPAHRGQGHSRALIEKQIDQAARRGADLALLFYHPDFEDGTLDGFQPFPRTDLTLVVAESPRRGAPMTMVRGGEERDLPAIAAMGRVSGHPFRFHLNRDVDFIQYAITKKRLLAGLVPAGDRQLLFFIAEEGTTAAAYIVITVMGDTWTIEECGDRDASGSRIGALLQALIAREPVERRPTIFGWLPSHFLPPQVTILSAKPSPKILMVRGLGALGTLSQLSDDNVLYWHNDLF
jgi:GNAT superfamily N-acetyltransferase